jgi:hypothetical protein
LQVGGWKLAVLLVAAALVPVVALFALRISAMPWRLRLRSTQRVIEAGLKDPKAPWAWQELEQRARSGRLSSTEANLLLDGLSNWMRRDYPHGYNEPMFWLRNVLDEVSKRNLAGEDRVLTFLEAYHGSPVCEVDRVRETNQTVHIECKWRSGWSEAPFGLAMLNQIRSFAIDSRPVSGAAFGTNWIADGFSVELQLPPLAPGEHTVTCEIESALVPNDSLAGLLPGDVGSKDWRSARRRWTRAAEGKLSVFSRTDEIVRLVHDPALNPVARGTVSVKRVVVRAQDGKAFVMVVPDLAQISLPEPVSFQISVKIAGKSYPCGQLWQGPKSGGRSLAGVRRSHPLSGQMGSEIDALDPQVKEADVVLTPDPRLVEAQPDIDRIWGEEIIFHVPLMRLDLPNN